MMRTKAYERRQRRREVQLIALRNEVRTALGGGPITEPYGGERAEQAVKKNEAARRDLLKTVDFDDCEPMGPGDTITD
jgi:hypothetical protein